MVTACSRMGAVERGNNGRFERDPRGKPTGLEDGLDMGLKEGVTDDFYP